MLTLDHLKLVNRDPRELKKLRGWLLVGEPLSETLVLHEPDDSCRRRESWELTLGRIIAALQPPAHAPSLDRRE
jgi:hypothetical protein